MKFTEYIKETKAEFKHVNWPSRRQTALFTAIVILISGAVAYYLGFFDFVFARLLEKIIG